MAPNGTDAATDSHDPIDDEIEASQERLDEVADKIEEGSDALDDHEPVDGDEDPEEHTFIQDGSIRTDLIDDAIRPAS